MTVVTTADTFQLYALAARHGLKLHGPLTVNELGLDYRIVIATVDDGRRWVLRIPRRAEGRPPAAGRASPRASPSAGYRVGYCPATARRRYRQTGGQSYPARRIARWPCGYQTGCHTPNAPAETR